MASLGLKTRLRAQAEPFLPRSGGADGAFSERIGKADNLCIGGSCADIHKHAPLRTQMREPRRRVRSEIVLSISSPQNAGRPG
jgi:hypothetical protein